MNNITILKDRLNEFVGKELSLEEQFTKTLLERELEKLQRESNNLWYAADKSGGGDTLKAIPLSEVATDHLINIIGYCLKHGYRNRCQKALEEFIRRDPLRAYAPIPLGHIYEDLSFHSTFEAERFYYCNDLNNSTTFVEFITQLKLQNYTEHQLQIYFWTIKGLI